MSKQRWMMCSVAIICILFFGTNQLTLTAESDVDRFIPRCEDVDQQMKKDINDIREIFIDEDFEQLTERVNELVTSQTSLEDEISLLEVTVCREDVYEDVNLNAKVNGYHSLLLYAAEMIQEKDIQFEEIKYSVDDLEEYLEIEGTLKGEREPVTVLHFYAYESIIGYLSREVDLEDEITEEVESQSLFNQLSGDLASSSSAVLQNPIEKFMDMVDSFFMGKSELQQQIFEKSAAANAGYFNMHYSVITGGEKTWHPVRILEYYPSRYAYETLDRAEQVRAELPDYWYPEEEIERGDWNGIVAYYDKHKPEITDYSRELYDYIFSNVLTETESFEELIEKVKTENE